MPQEKTEHRARKLPGPFNAEALRNGEWTKVDLSSKGIMVDKDFYLVYIQSKPDPYSPGLAMDETGKNLTATGSI